MLRDLQRDLENICRIISTTYDPIAWRYCVKMQAEILRIAKEIWRSARSPTERNVSLSRAIQVIVSEHILLVRGGTDGVPLCTVQAISHFTTIGVNLMPEELDEEGDGDGFEIFDITHECFVAALA